MRTNPIERSLPVNPREALAVVADRRGETMSNLPRLIGKSDGYLARYIRDGVPVSLPANDRQLLARYLGVQSTVIG